MIHFLFLLLLEYHSARVPGRYRNGETEDARQARIHIIAQAQVEECRQNPIPGLPLAACVALGTTILKWESGLLEEVHSGVKKGPAGEICLFQLHRTVTDAGRITKEELSRSVGTDLESTRMCVNLGMRIVRYHMQRCKIRYENGGWSTMMRLFAEYHRPSNTCKAWPMQMSVDRSRSYQFLLQQLHKAPTE